MKILLTAIAILISTCVNAQSVIYVDSENDIAYKRYSDSILIYNQYKIALCSMKQELMSIKTHNQLRKFCDRYSFEFRDDREFIRVTNLISKGYAPQKGKKVIGVVIQEKGNEVYIEHYQVDRVYSPKITVKVVEKPKPSYTIIHRIENPYGQIKTVDSIKIR